MATTMIYKYALDIVDLQTVEMHRLAKILCIQTQKGIPCLWAEVDPEQPTERRFIRMYGTGQPHVQDDPYIPEEYGSKYLGTYQVMKGNIVFHVYEVSRVGL